MNQYKKTYKQHSNISQEMLKPTIGMLLPMCLIIAVLIVLILTSNYDYSKVLYNATTAADFNTEFKTTIDSKMYTHVIQPRNESSLNDLPYAEMDYLEGILLELEASTVLENNCWRVQSMLSMCGNLRQYMEEIALCPRYDDRMELLDRNISGETGLTRLIESYMNAYLVDEVREMNRLQQQISNRIKLTVVLIAVLFVMTLTLIIIYSKKKSGQIITSIEELADKAQQFGKGDFSLLPIQTSIQELETLSYGLDEMSQQIKHLISRQIENQQALHQAELGLLQAQINPHFLYNTLDSIAVLAEMHRDDDVISMVTWLSTFFRTCLSDGRNIISLRDEVAHVTSYLEIQQVRYSSRMSYDIQIDDGLLDCYVPKLILQPLVENALYHGIKNRRTLGHIHIRGAQSGNNMSLVVEDDGIGMTDDLLQKLQSSLSTQSGSGFGASNVQQRIQLYCGQAYGLSYRSQAGNGTSVSILLPVDLQPEIPGSSKNETEITQ